MRGRWELSDAQWQLIEPILRAEATPRWSRSSVARHASSPQRDFVGLGDGGTVARSAQEISAVPDLPSSFPAMGAGEQVGTHLAYLGGRVAGPRETATGRGFHRRLLHGGKKGGLAVGPTKRGKGTKIIDDDAPQARASVRVSRYELPTFTVKADPDRKYYLPGDDATITISADYLFGKPVRNANVHLVNQQDRHWDFKEQKWVTEESNAIEGTFDKDGKFEAKVDLQDEFKDFNPEDYSHYKDGSIAQSVGN